MRLSTSLIPLALAIAAAAGAGPAVQGESPLRIFLRGGPKTHGPAGNGQHDGPAFVKEWQPLLSSRGARVEADLRFPTGAELDRTDVLVMFAANAGDIEGGDRANLERFLKRGGGIVCLHDAVLSRDPQWFKTIIGGAWENGVARYFEGENTYYYVNPSHPITRGAANFTLTDEVYWNLHLMPDIQVLAVTPQPRRQTASSPAGPDTIGSLIPQLWVYEHQLPGGQPYRAVVSLLGHHFSTFSSPHVRAIFLRAIAWAGRRDADSLATAEELSALH
jgi:type 1 glutamine amidotransferase